MERSSPFRSKYIPTDEKLYTKDNLSKNFDTEDDYQFESVTSYCKIFTFAVISIVILAIVYFVYKIFDNPIVSKIACILGIVLIFIYLYFITVEVFVYGSH
jgi:hypothetical protein